MKPALSVIFFTVASGAGLGLFAWLAAFDLFTLLRGTESAGMQPVSMARAALVAYVLVVAGLCASTLHLANKKNAWRSFTRFRSSWLSREAVFAVAFLVVALVYTALLVVDGRGALRWALALVVLVLAVTVLVCTAMIYASLKPIRQWHTCWTPATYVVLGVWSGAVIARCLRSAAGAGIDGMPLALLTLGVAAAIVKLMYWRTIDGEAGSITMEQALGVSHGVGPPGSRPAPGGGATVMRARLLDTGHTHGTFLTDEFGFALARRRRGMLRAAFWIFAMAIPLAWLVLGPRDSAVAVVVAVACIGGLLAERWLFFAEARHTVRLFHGDART